MCDHGIVDGASAMLYTRVAHATAASIASNTLLLRLSETACNTELKTTHDVHQPCHVHVGR